MYCQAKLQEPQEWLVFVLFPKEGSHTIAPSSPCRNNKTRGTSFAFSEDGVSF